MDNIVTKIAFYLFLLPIIGKSYLWILKPEWSYVSRIWAFVDMPLYIIAMWWLYNLTFKKSKSNKKFSGLLLISLLTWEVILNIVLPENWVLESVFSILGIGCVLGFLAMIPGYIIITRDCFSRYSDTHEH